VDFHCAGVDVGFERVVGVSEIGKCVCHGVIGEFGLRRAGPSGKAGHPATLNYETELSLTRKTNSACLPNSRPISR
jgi:hypothetical protein